MFLCVNFERNFNWIEGKTPQIHPYAAHSEVVDDETVLFVVQLNESEKANKRKRTRKRRCEEANFKTRKEKKNKNQKREMKHLYAFEWMNMAFCVVRQNVNFRRFLCFSLGALLHKDVTRNMLKLCMVIESMPTVCTRKHTYTHAHWASTFSLSYEC